MKIFENNIFNNARLKLTLWYVLIILLISVTLSSLFYQRVSKAFEREFHRMEGRFKNHQQMMGLQGEAYFQFAAADLEEAKQRVAKQLLWINAFVLILGSGSAWILSGKTLKPIQNAMEEQKRFVADAAHELRTPLTSLKTSLEVNLMNADLSKQARQILQENLEDVSGLEVLTNNLLRLARIEEKRISRQPVDLHKIVDKALKQVKPLAEKKHIKINAKLPEEELVVLGDEPSLLDVLVIFLDNAIKYSPNKSEIELIAEELKGRVKIEIKDHGKGIAKHHLKHIFDRFYRVDSARSSSEDSGYGLGLSVAQKIVRGHQGKIEVESELNKGSVFKVFIPLAG